MKVLKKPVLWIVLGSLLVLGVIGFVLHGFWHPYRMPSGSMSPTIQPGSYLLVNDWAYQSAADVKRGNVVVFEPPSSPYTNPSGVKSTYVFRVIGLPGDTVSFDDQGRFVVNGAELQQLERGSRVYERQSEKTYEVTLGNCRAGDEVTVGGDSFFVAGDNRPSALDSRYWGTVPFASISGRARVD